MIDLLGEARNHMELYQVALSQRNLDKEDNGTIEDYKKTWEEHYFLDFPKARGNPQDSERSLLNPQLLKRSLLLVARWCLYHNHPAMSFSETLVFLDTWYTTVMQFACKGMSSKASAQTESMVQEHSRQYKDNGERFKNLDKIHYYRLVCQAQSDGPLTSVHIQIPFRILDVWKERKTPKIDRGLHILYHYCGEMPGVTKTEIECWLTGNSSSLKENESISCVNSPGRDGGRMYFLDVGNDFCWDDAEEGIEILEAPCFANELEDEKLDALRIQKNPDYWINTRLSTSDDMLKHYAKKKDLSTQSPESGKVPKAHKLRRCILAMLYASVGNSNPDSWRGWNELLELVPWNEKIYLDWMQIEQWTRENYGFVLSAMSGKGSSDNESVGAFFQNQGKRKFYAESGTDNQGSYIKFTCKELRKNNYQCLKT